MAEAVDGIDEVYRFAADIGGAGYIFTGEHDPDVMHNSATPLVNRLLTRAKLFDRSKLMPVFGACFGACLYRDSVQSCAAHCKLTFRRIYCKKRLIVIFARKCSPMQKDKKRT
jgi:hypothetical protein